MIVKRLITAFLLLLFWSGPLSAQQRLEVCPDCPLKNLTEGIAAARPFDTIYVLKGRYYENDVDINKPLIIIGVDFPVIDGRGQGEILQITADSVLLTGVEVRNVGTSYIHDQAGIYLKEVKDVQVIGNRLINTFFGIYLEYSQHVLIKDNHIEGRARDEVSSANAIHLWKCHKVHIVGNYATGHRDGIYMEFVDSSLVEDNESTRNLRYGLHFMFSNDDKYFNNRFLENGVGVAVMYSDRIEMTGNDFTHNWSPVSYGLLLKEIRYSKIRHNRFLKNTTAIYMENSIESDVFENDFISNGWGVKIMGNCEEVVFHSNNFKGNSFDVSTNAKQNYNKFNHNYWSAYTGYDLDHDGTGDIPFRPVKLFGYLVEQVPTSIVLLRSPFMELLNHAENVMPVITPETLKDESPKMKPIIW